MTQYYVEPGSKLLLKDCDPDETGDYKNTDQEKDKAKAETAELIAKLAGLQERLYAHATRSLLIVLQGMDTSGKDGTIRSVMSSAHHLFHQTASLLLESFVIFSNDFFAFSRNPSSSTAST